MHHSIATASRAVILGLLTIGLVVPPASAHHSAWPDDNCIVEDIEYREDAQFLVDIYHREGENPYHYDNDQNGVACDDGSNSLPNDPNARLSPVGNLDVVASAGSGQIRVAGWTFDPDVDQWAAPVHIYVDGRGAAVIPRAETRRPDVDAAFGVGSRHGFDTTIAVGGGSHQVCVYAINYGPVSPNTGLGCRVVTAPSYSPVGAFDTLHFFPDGSPVVYGWAADPEAITQSLDIHVYVDGRRGYAFQTASHPRPDVTAATGAPNAGFVGIVPPQGPGPHQICAYAINVGATGTNTLLGCKRF